MCLIAFNWQTHPVYKLIYVANRDEFYERKALPAHFWEEPSGILAGKDLSAGGTWMGISTTGKIAALTNYRDPSNLKKEAPTRGRLVSDYLSQARDAKTYLQKIRKKSSEYNGFNLIAGDSKQLFYFSNYQNKITAIKPGTHGLSNHLLNTQWFKVQRAKQKLDQLIDQNELNVDKLLDSFLDIFTPKDDQVQQTGMPFAWEKLLSSMFIKSKAYGTRCTTALLLDYFDHLTFSERVYDNELNVFSSQTFHLKLQPEEEKIEKALI